MTINPYQAPQAAPPVEPAPPARRFRWRVIPAALSAIFGTPWLAGGAVNLAIWLSHSSPSAGYWKEWLCGELGLFLVVGLCGAGHLAAGWQWMRGRWLFAFGCNALAGGAMGLFVALVDAMR